MNFEAVKHKQLLEMRQQHIGRLLQQAFRGFNNRSLTKLRERGHVELTLAHMQLLPYLDLEGTHITVLAERAGITKQSMGQLILDLEKRGYIERRVDPLDRRATLVLFTSRGWQFLQDAYEIKTEIEAEFQALIGEAEMQQLREALRRLSTPPTQ